MSFFLAFLIGIAPGLRAMTAPVAVCWPARMARLDLGGTWLAFLGSVWAP